MNNEYFYMYHGGKKWYEIPTEVSAGIKNRAEYGAGIYTSNMYDTAIKYAKGSKVIQKLKLKKNFTDIKNVNVSYDEILELIKKLKLSNYKNILTDLDMYVKRTNTDKISLDIVNNLIVNNEASYGLKSKKNIVEYYISKGADAKYISQSGNEFWILIFNPKIISSFEKVDPKKWGTEKFPFELPQIEMNTISDNKQELPFTEQKIKTNEYIRTFDKNTNENELKWHIDGEDRIVESLHKTDWMIQLDNNIPQRFEGKIKIKEGVYHRLIKGTNDLQLKIKKL